MRLPVMPPVSPMLAKLQDAIPEGEGWLYEPKWDGFRAIVFRDGDEVHVASRDAKPLERYMPELVEPLRKALPQRCVLDGEVVVSSKKGLDFDALLLRIHPAKSRIDMLAEQHPTSFIAFDLLADGDEDLRGSPATERRKRLETFLRVIDTGSPPAALSVGLTPQTADTEVGRGWFEGLEAIGLDGLIAKRADSPYVEGKRTLVKIKHKRTADCVVGGFRLSKKGDGIGSLLLGVYGPAGLQYVGHTSSFKAAERRALLEQLRAIEGESAFGGARAPGGPSRWASAEEKSWHPVEPVLVCEVSYDYLQGERFRHAATFVRWRTDKAPQECRFDQLT